MTIHRPGYGQFQRWHVWLCVFSSTKKQFWATYIKKMFFYRDRRHWGYVRKYVFYGLGELNDKTAYWTVWMSKFSYLFNMHWIRNCPWLLSAVITDIHRQISLLIVEQRCSERPVASLWGFSVVLVSINSGLSQLSSAAGLFSAAASLPAGSAFIEHSFSSEAKKK